MSKRTSSRIKRQSNTKMPKSNNTQSTDAPDTLERRRIQNRLAQRNHRKKVRDHINALETRVINSMLQRPPSYIAPLPRSTSASGSSTPTHLSQQVSINALHEISSGLQDTAGSMCSGANGPESSLHHSPTSYTPSPRIERDSYFLPNAAFVPLASPCLPSADSRVPGVTFEIVQQYQSPSQTSDENNEVQSNDESLFVQNFDAIEFSTIVQPQLLSSALAQDQSACFMSIFDEGQHLTTTERVSPPNVHTPMYESIGWLGDHLAASPPYTTPSVVPAQIYHHPSSTSNHGMIDLHNVQSQAVYPHSNIVFDVAQNNATEVDNQQSVTYPQYPQNVSIYRSPQFM